MPASRDSDPSFFQGSEFPRLVVLAGFAIALALALWTFPMIGSRPGKQPPITSVEAIPPADDNPVLLDVEDKTRLLPEEGAAYQYLLEKARATPLEKFKATAYRDALFSQIYTRPARYRGVPIRLEGIAMRITVEQEVAIAKEGILYEVWLRTADSTPNPYVVVFEDAPEGFPKGPNIEENVVFYGYFLKLMAYQARDTARAAPLLIGKLVWRSPRAQAEPVANPHAGWVGLVTQSPWLLLIGLVLVYSVVRLAFTARLFGRIVQSVVGPSAVTTHQGGRIAGRFTSPYQRDISPEELQAWVDSVANRELDPDDDSELSKARRSPRPEA
ncbi:hypothetical protein Isop_2620 [Isosphaera pallida ATCC 43644]|uniref:Uncharacterized protein n=1 Tax=Isosphaera pallida (strain ATCC 43644 / DSM 9630 / IS1B) TaxID=575540 RepID=E8QZ48_ISOPI|nr:hypothetical protein [Isosphaera pallida]ADV63190.1 hypothetical protein Isop_2620 [Isosphaera pallida ATCC 43644]